MQHRELLVRTVLIWLLLEVIAAAQVQRQEETLLWTWCRSLATPFVATASWTHDLAIDLAWGLGDSQRLVSRVRQLEEELAASRTRCILLEENVAALREAQRFLQRIEDLGADSVVARCLFRDLSSSRIEVSAGYAQGIRADTPALSPDGLVGRVVRIGANRCWVETITHPAAAVAVRSEDGNAVGLAVGTGRGTLSVQFVSRQTQLLRGTRLVASGADGIYPPGVPVAEVSSIRQTDGPFLEVHAKPYTEFDTLRMVMLLPGWTVDSSAGSIQ